MQRGAKDLTPAMKQYMSIKREHPDSILFFRMGDFYEMFFEDAKAASKVLGIALTSRDREREIPMCGVPYHAAAAYISKLVNEGYKVAVCDQLEDARAAKGIVERGVTRVITPGVALDEELLESKANNFIAAALKDRKGAVGFSYMDVTTGEFMATELKDTDGLVDEIARIRPMELVLPQGSSDAEEFPELSAMVKKVTFVDGYDFDLDVAVERLLSHFKVHSLDGFGLSGLRLGTSAAGALFHYVRETQKRDLDHVKRCRPYFTDDYLIIDSATRRNLELTENLTDGSTASTLIELLDRTATAMGGRRLRNWLACPLKDPEAIRERLDAVEELFCRRDARKRLFELLSDVHDIERLAGRISLGVAGPRDLVSLKSSLKKIPELIDVLKDFKSKLMRDICSSLDPVQEAVSLVEEAIVDSPPVSVRDGGVIRDGFNSELDEQRTIGSGGKDRVAAMEAAERERTGIPSLRVGYNRVFGYYIEVTKAHLSSVPGDYIRKQTLVNAERFVTPALKEWEEKIISAEERARALEAELFSAVREKAAAFTPRVQKTAGLVSLLDVINSLAEVAEDYGYTRPVVDDGDTIEIVEGRHPVIEAASSGEFVPNDLRLDPEENQIIILTGPNMAGKSTYLRQNALIVLMCQIGSFIPASKATIGVVDRIFTRVGASDDLARGRSTFMVEMNETANILNNATSKSLVILDEVGRGTSTFDGLSIAWAVVEYLHDNPCARPRTLFATHYHELTDLSLTKERVKNYNMAVREFNGRIVFLRRVEPGGISRSYGIHVARLAGLPDPVVERAVEILKNLEEGELNESGAPRFAAPKASSSDGQINLFAVKDPVHEALRSLDINRITPLEALSILNRLREMLER